MSCATIQNSTPVVDKIVRNNSVNFNILWLIHEIFSEQRRNSQLYGKASVLSTLKLQDDQYKERMGKYNKQIEKTSEKSAELRAIADAKNQSPSGWKNVAGFFTDLAVGAIMGAVLGGPIGFLIGGSIGMGLFAGLQGSGITNESAVFSLVKSVFGGNQDSEMKAISAEMDVLVKVADKLRDEATQKQNETSRTMQTEFEPLEAIAKALAEAAAGMRAKNMEVINPWK